MTPLGDREFEPYKPNDGLGLFVTWFDPIIEAKLELVCYNKGNFKKVLLFWSFNNF